MFLFSQLDTVFCNFAESLIMQRTFLPNIFWWAYTHCPLPHTHQTKQNCKLTRCHFKSKLSFSVLLTCSNYPLVFNAQSGLMHSVHAIIFISQMHRLIRQCLYYHHPSKLLTLILDYTTINWSVIILSLIIRRSLYNGSMSL